MGRKLLRYSSKSKTTLGVLLINNKFQCYTLEDRYRKEKVYGETRISAGTYELALRNYGGHFDRYTEKYEGHKGMIQVKEVPNFTDILIHIGNYSEDSHGCILVGSSANNNVKKKGQISASTEAYLDLYFKILPVLESREKVLLNIIDLDTPYGY